MTSKQKGKKTVGMVYVAIKRILLILTLLLCVALEVAAYGGTIDPRITASPSVVVLALPYLVLLTGAVAVIWLLIGWWRHMILAVVAIAAAWPSVMVVCPLHMFPPKVKQDEELLQFKVMTFNAQYFIHDEQEYWKNDNQAADYLLNSDADVILVQEGDIGKYLEQMPSMKDKYAALKSKYPYRTDDKPHRISMLSRYPFSVVGEDIDEESPDPDVYAVYYKMKIKGRDLYIANVHLQSIMLSKDDKEFFKEYTAPHDMKKKIDERGKFRRDLLSKLKLAFLRRADQVDMVRTRIAEMGENVMVCGDFNDTPCSYAYRTVRGMDLSDAYQECSFGPEITYHENRFLFRIDHILYRGDLRAVNMVRPDVKISDHYPLIATMVWNPRSED